MGGQHASFPMAASCRGASEIKIDVILTGKITAARSWDAARCGEIQYFLVLLKHIRGDTLYPRSVDQFLAQPEDIMIFFSLSKKYSCVTAWQQS